MITYKGCTIYRTDVRLSSPNPRENTRQLYAISGRLTKGPAPRPFLTSERAAKIWITQQDGQAPHHPLYRPVVTPQGRYQTAAAAAAAHGISRQAASRRAATGTAGWHFEGD